MNQVGIITNDFITILMKYIGKADGVICMSYTADNIFSKIIYIDLTSKDALFKSLEKQRIDIYIEVLIMCFLKGSMF